jgi:hypothetical protein
MRILTNIPYIVAEKISCFKGDYEVHLISGEWGMLFKVRTSPMEDRKTGKRWSQRDKRCWKDSDLWMFFNRN